MCCGKRKPVKRPTARRSGLIVHADAIKYFGKVTPEGKLDSIHGLLALEMREWEKIVGSEVVIDGNLKEGTLHVRKCVVVNENGQISPSNVEKPSGESVGNAATGS
jgi:hypothetical protein